MNRTGNAIRNAAFGIISRIVTLILGFISRTVFIYVLGSTYLGVNGLYTEILSLLSFAELGFGSAMTFALYKPVAEHDREKTVRLLDFYRKIYRIIALVILALGLCLLPFLPYIVKGAEALTVRDLRLYYLIFLFDTVISYFVSYKFSYLNALQKNYIETNISTIVKTAAQIFQCIIILTTKSFLAYLAVNSLVLLISRGAISFYLNREFPILAEKAADKLTRAEKASIFTEVRGLAVHQFASVAVHSTDNILISSLSGLGVVAVGYVSNYNMLMTSVLAFVTIVFGSVTSGLGNLAAASTTDRFRTIFKQLNFANFWIYGFCSVSFWILIPPFITLWIGSDKLIDHVSFTLIIINCYMQGQSTMFHYARIAKGQFGRDKWYALLQALVNLAVSVIGARYLGLAGIYIGTVVSRLVYVVLRPLSTYRFLFEESAAEYYKIFFRYFSVVVLAAGVTCMATRPFSANVTVSGFLLMCCLDLILPNLVFLLFSRKRPEFAAWLQWGKEQVRRLCYKS